MLNAKKLRFLTPKVAELIELLKNYPEDYKVAVSGNYFFYLHVDDDEKTLIFDESDLGDYYEENIYVCLLEGDEDA